MLTQYVIGPEYLLVDGNGERFFLLFLAVFVLAGVVVLEAWSLARVRPWTAAQAQRRGIVLLLLATFVVAAMYLANGFLEAMADFPAYVTERAASSEYDEHPTVFWLVATLDLAIVVPLTIGVGIGLLRGREWARRGFYGVIGWFALVPGSVAAMALVMVARDDPAADAGKAVVLTVAAVAFSALAARSFRPVLAARRNDSSLPPDAVTAAPLPEPSHRDADGAYPLPPAAAGG